MKKFDADGFDTAQFDDLPTLSFTEAAWMAGVTPESLERSLENVGLTDTRNIPLSRLVQSGFTLLGQRDSQLAMFRMQLAAALQREKELAEALRSKLTAMEPPISLIVEPLSPTSGPMDARPKKEKKGKKKKRK